MERKEQIINEANERYTNYDASRPFRVEGFVAGAEWADANNIGLAQMLADRRVRIGFTNELVEQYLRGLDKAEATRFCADMIVKLNEVGE